MPIQIRVSAIRLVLML